MTRLRSQPWLMTTAVILVGGASACRAHIPSELGTHFAVTNDTNQTLHVVSRIQHPGQPPASAGPVDVNLTIAPFEKNYGVRDVVLSAGNCEDITIFAYDPAGTLVDQDPSPICQNKNGDTVTWVIKQK